MGTAGTLVRMLLTLNPRFGEKARLEIRALGYLSLILKFEGFNLILVIKGHDFECDDLG